MAFKWFGFNQNSNFPFSNRMLSTVQSFWPWAIENKAISKMQPINVYICFPAVPLMHWWLTGFSLNLRQQLHDYYTLKSVCRCSEVNLIKIRRIALQDNISSSTAAVFIPSFVNCPNRESNNLCNAKLRIKVFAWHSCTCNARHLWILCTWCDNDAVGFFDYVNGLVHIDLSVSANNLHGLPACCGGGAVTTQDHIGQGAVHSLHGREDNI